jgi:SAM-dependent methyltransferase
MQLFTAIRDYPDPALQNATLERVRAFVAARADRAAAAAAVAIIGTPEIDDARVLGMLRARLGTPRLGARRLGPGAEAPGPGRERSRLHDVERELAVVAAGAGPAAAYLDIGCAEGRISAAVAQALGLPRERAHACDIAPQAMPPGVTFARSGPAGLPYAGASFDFITMFMAAHHFADAAAMFAEARRVAKAGAALLVREHDCQSAAAALYYDAVHALYACVFGSETTPEQFIEQYAAGGFACYRSQAAWIALAGAHGFELHPDAAPHGPVINGAPGRDRYDSFYALFRAAPA